jgi:uncharacterized protein
MTEIKLLKKVNLKNYTMVEGFPGIGLVGTIAAGYIVEKKAMEPVGYILSDDFPPMTTIHHGRPYLPARIYRDSHNKFCVLLAEFVVPSKVVYPLSSAILDFVHSSGIKQIVSLAGMTSAKAGTGKIYGIASNDTVAKFLEKKGIELIKEGVTTGVSGVLLAKCALEGFPAMSLLAESQQGYPDPRAAATLLEKLDSIIGMKIDTKALMKEAGVIETKMRQMTEQLRKVKKTYKRAEGGEYPPMYG